MTIHNNWSRFTFILSSYIVIFHVSLRLGLFNITIHFFIFRIFKQTHCLYGCPVTGTEILCLYASACKISLGSFETPTTLFNKNIVFRPRLNIQNIPFFADFRLKIFLWTFLDYVFGVWLMLSYFGARLQSSIKASMIRRTKHVSEM